MSNEHSTPRRYVLHEDVVETLSKIRGFKYRLEKIKRRVTTWFLKLAQQPLHTDQTILYCLLQPELAFHCASECNLTLEMPHLKSMHVNIIMPIYNTSLITTVKTNIRY